MVHPMADMASFVVTHSGLGLLPGRTIVVNTIGYDLPT